MKFKFIAKDKISYLPKSPGVYAFLARRLVRRSAKREGGSLGEGGKKGRQILYIGKAANLRERVKNHFQQPGFRGGLFVNQAEKLGYIKTGSDIEALILEANLIKKYKPKYNVVWRDDKNYFFVGITKEDFPTVFITHQPKFRKLKVENRKSTIDIRHSTIDYVGPFVQGRVLKQALNALRRVFPYRICKPYAGKPCLWYQLARCPGPCLLGSKLAKQMPELEKTIKKESQRNVKNLKRFLEGGRNQVLKNLKAEMKTASKIRDYERAAKIRDQISALERILEHGRIFDWSEPETSRKRRSPFSYRCRWEKTERELKKILEIKGRVKRIEAYDVSNIQGQNATGSMVTFINGQADKNFYRRFKVRIAGKPDDVAMLKEILTRRFTHSEWGWPDLILIDGGKAQLNAAVSSIKYQVLGIKIPVAAIAKRENKLFIEGRKGPVFLKTLPREIFNLILQLRDEAHRFAITYHRKLREKF